LTTKELMLSTLTTSSNMKMCSIPPYFKMKSTPYISYRSYFHYCIQLI
jgi:hypothetical protein